MAVEPYAARLNVDYPEQLDRLTTVFRLIWIIPIAIILGVLTANGNDTVVNEAGQQVRNSGGGILSGLFVATVLMIVFRMRYPRWWFDFARVVSACRRSDPQEQHRAPRGLRLIHGGGNRERRTGP